MLKFALKNMAIKKIQVILVLISIVISAGVGVLAYNIGEQVSDGITGNAAYYSVIIGPSGSETQLAMNSMYFTESPLGTIPYDVVIELQQDNRVVSAIPFAMADSYNGFNCVGTTTEYLNGKEIAEGRLFDDAAVHEVVLGASVAEVCDVKVGDEIHTSHSVGDEHHTSLLVVGILKESHTSFDNVVFTQLKTIWDVHKEGHEDEGDHEEEAGEEHEHNHMANSVCAVMVKTTNPGTAMSIVTEFDDKIFTMPDGDSVTLQAIEPMSVIRGVLEDTDNTKYIVFALCAIILVMNVMIISIITLLNMYHATKEIKLMRLIGISMKKINLLYIIQNGIIGFVSVVLAFLVSRVCLALAGDYVASMGVVLNLSKSYPMEWVILAAVFLVSVIPTIISTAVMSKKDGIAG